MARKTTHSKRRHKKAHSFFGRKRRHSRRAHRRSGPVAVSSSMSIQSAGQIAAATAILRFLEGGAYLLGRKNGLDTSKWRIFVPLAVSFAAGKGWLKIPGLYPVAVSSTVNATIDTFDFLKNVFDLKFMDQSAGSAAASKPTAGLMDMSPRQISQVNGLVMRSGPYSREGFKYQRSTGMAGYVR